MAGSAGSVYVDLLLRDGRYRQGLKQSRDYTKRWSGQISGDTKQAESAFAQVLNPVSNLEAGVLRLGASVAGALSVSQIINYSDTWKQLQGRLGLVVDDAAELASVNQELSAIAERTRQPLESIINLYARMGQMIPENIRGSLNLLDVTEGVATSLAITGESSLSAQAAIIQFTQALSTNFEAAGQEIRSIQEQAPRLALALQRSIGDGTQSLKELKETGQLTTESLGKAFRRGTEEFDRLLAELEKIDPTVRQAFTELNNQVLQFVGKSGGITTAAKALADGIRLIAENLELVAKGLQIGALALALKSLQEPVGKLGVLYAANVASVLNLSKASQTYSNEVLQSAEKIKLLSLEQGKSQRVAEALAKQQMALSGAMSSNIIAVNSAGAATVRYTSILKNASVGVVNLARNLVASIGPWNLAILALGTAYVFLKDRMSEAEKIAEKYPKLFAEISGAADQAGKAINELELGAAKQRLQELQDEADNLRESLGNLSLEGKVLKTNFITVGDSIRNTFNVSEQNELIEKLKELNFQVENGSLTVDEAKGAYADLREEFGSFDNSIDNARDRTLAFVTAGKQLEEVLGNIESATNRVNAANKNTQGITPDWLKTMQDMASGTEFNIGGVKPRTKPEVPEDFDPYASLDMEAQQRREKAQQSAISATRELNSVYRTNREYITGMTREEIARADKIEELEKLLGTKYIPTQEKLNEAIKRYDESLQDNKENVNQWGIDISEVGKNAAESIQDSFADFLFDPFENGVESMAEEFGKTIQRMLAEAAAADLMRVLFGNDDTIGLFGTGGKNLPNTAPTGGISEGGMFSGIGDFFAGFFADGGTIPSGQFGIVGERGPELAFGGSSGKTIVPFGGGSGGNVNVTVINNGNNNVSTRETQTANGMDIQVMIDEAVAQKIATPGTRTNRALNAYSNRGLVTR